jgi:hypothetical protein
MMAVAYMSSCDVFVKRVSKLSKMIEKYGDGLIASTRFIGQMAERSKAPA